jgi:ribonuclease Z
MIDVCLLGQGGMMPLPGRPLSATAFRIGGEVMLFDCGEGAQVSWRASNFNFRALGTILFSHRHADHIAGLPGILFQVAYSDREEPLHLYGPVGLQPMIEGLLTVVGGLPFELHLHTLEPGEQVALPGGAVLSTQALRHRGACLGYVVDLPRAPRFLPEQARALAIPVEHWSLLQSGRSVEGVLPEEVSGPPRRGLRLALITDTSPFTGLAEFVAGSDLLICESTYVLDEDEERAIERGHMTMRHATTLAHAAGVRRLWLTHFSPKVQCPADFAEQAQRLFPATEIGYSGLSIELSFDS